MTREAVAVVRAAAGVAVFRAFAWMLHPRRSLRPRHPLRSIAIAGLALLILPALVVPTLAQNLVPVPPLQSRVTDLTGTLTPPQQQSLEAELAALEEREGSQVAILVVPTTRPEAIEQFGIRVADEWQIGRGTVDGQAVDDGVLIIVAKDDRRVRIEVGYGLEGAIPDAYARRIIDESITPRFRQGDYAGGLQAAVGDLARLIEGEALPPAWSGDARGGSSQQDTDWVALLMGAFVVGLIVRSIFGRVLGSMLGGALGGVASWVGGASAMLAGVGGFFLFLVLLTMFSTGAPMGRTGRHTWRSGPGGFPGGFGGGWGGGGGFRGGGGGFGGGGGGFGGGGASGGW